MRRRHVGCVEREDGGPGLPEGGQAGADETVRRALVDGEVESPGGGFLARRIRREPQGDPALLQPGRIRRRCAGQPVDALEERIVDAIILADLIGGRPQAGSLPQGLA